MRMRMRIVKSVLMTPLALRTVAQLHLHIKHGSGSTSDVWLRGPSEEARAPFAQRIVGSQQEHNDGTDLSLADEVTGASGATVGGSAGAGAAVGELAVVGPTRCAHHHHTAQPRAASR